MWERTWRSYVTGNLALMCLHSALFILAFSPLLPETYSQYLVVEIAVTVASGMAILGVLYRIAAPDADNWLSRWVYLWSSFSIILVMIAYSIVQSAVSPVQSAVIALVLLGSLLVSVEMHFQYGGRADDG